MVEEVERWEVQLQSLHSRISPRFRRVESRRRAWGYLRGLMSPVTRKNGWQLAEWMGDFTPDGMDHFRTQAPWDAEGVRDDLRAYVVEQLGEEAGILIPDETGFLKKGRHSVGVAPQYSGTAGQVANCQVGVFLGYASSRGRALVDRALYLPQEWVEDEARRQRAGIPSSVVFATKPQLVCQMLQRALDAGVPCRWVVADSVYGSDRPLREWLVQRGQAFVLGVASDEWVSWSVPGSSLRRWMTVTALAGQLPPERWQRLSAGEGVQGPRLYDWVLEPIRETDSEGSGSWGVLIRRSLHDPSEVAFFEVFTPGALPPLEQVVAVAGQRWRIETCFEQAKSECGLDEYECRRWEAWHRHVTLALLALAFLSVVGAAQKGATVPTPKS